MVDFLFWCATCGLNVWCFTCLLQLAGTTKASECIL